MSFYKSETTCIIRSRIKTYQEQDGHKNKDRAYKVVIGWVPGHSGVLGNMDADGLAKEAINEPKDPRIKVPAKD